MTPLPKGRLSSGNPRTGTRDPCCSFAPGDPAPRDESEERALAFRRRLIAEIEARGGFTFADLKHADDEAASAAWGHLADVAESVGVPEEQWAEIAGAAGWEKVPPQKGE